MSERTNIADLMQTTGVQFGTSGARGLVSQMTDRVCYAYVRAFLQHLEGATGLERGAAVAVAGDLRPSTPRIMNAAFQAILDAGYQALNAGYVPSPAVALYGIEHGIPSLMVTGSHIPDDRNGIKFNKQTGEILKADELSIRAQSVVLPQIFDAQGMLRTPPRDVKSEPAAKAAYVERYISAFSADALQGLRVGLYEHSAVGRDILYAILTRLGASVVRLARSDKFIPVDTEAIRPEDVVLAKAWSAELKLDAIVSTDGDSDRPLVSDENGKWLRGDVVGILCAQFLGANAVATPVSSNSALEQSGNFQQVERTKIGSPFVIEAMLRLAAQGAKAVGYEANGGFLTATDFTLPGNGKLRALPTRDAALVILAILANAAQRKQRVSALLETLPARFTVSGRIKDFPTELSQSRLAELANLGAPGFAGCFPEFEAAATLNVLDGLRFQLKSGDIVHLRASGNAPELRCYVEAASEAAAELLLNQALTVLDTWRS